MVARRAAATLRNVRSDSGQAAVEAAIVLPGTIFLLLCTIQLTQIQQARLMLQYGAFNAARTGIVRNGDNGSSAGISDGAMRDAAILSILPTYGRTDSLASIAKTLAAFAARAAVLQRLGLAAVNVAILTPRRQDFDVFGAHLGGRELDFDDVRPAAADATLLSIRVQYLYELRVPFANKLIQSLWRAGRRAAADGGNASGDLGALDRVAAAGRYLLPLQAWSTMRMQSNAFARWSAP
jgi:hypothetical protein